MLENCLFCVLDSNLEFYKTNNNKKRKNIDTEKKPTTK